MENCMQTRIQKWAEYRQQIINQGILLNQINDQSMIVKNYKAKIDSILPKILKGVDTEYSIYNLISVDHSDYQSSNDIKEFVTLIDNLKIEPLTKEINELNSLVNEQSILDDKNNISKE